MDYTQAKLIILYVFDKMDIPLQEDTVIEMCASKNDWIPYLDCRPAFLQLLEVGFITEASRTEKFVQYVITADGRMCLNHFYTKIPISIRDEITADVRHNRLSYKKKQEYFSDYYKNADGSYTVVLKIIAPAQPVMELKMNNLSRHVAKWIFKNWEEKAPQVYEMLYELLID